MRLTPQEKAKELIEKMAMKIDSSYRSDFPKKITIHNAKQCALIAIDEMIAIQEDFYGLVLTAKFRERCVERVEYLQQVKEEIKKL